MMIVMICEDSHYPEFHRLGADFSVDIQQSLPIGQHDIVLTQSGVIAKTCNRDFKAMKGGFQYRALLLCSLFLLLFFAIFLRNSTGMRQTLI